MNILIEEQNEEYEEQRFFGGVLGVGMLCGLVGQLMSLSYSLSWQFMASSGLAAMGTAAPASQWSS